MRYRRGLKRGFRRGGRRGNRRGGWRKRRYGVGRNGIML